MALFISTGTGSSPVQSERGRPRVSPLLLPVVSMPSSFPASGITELFAREFVMITLRGNVLTSGNLVVLLIEMNGGGFYCTPRCDASCRGISVYRSRSRYLDPDRLSHEHDVTHQRRQSKCFLQSIAALCFHRDLNIFARALYTL